MDKIIVIDFGSQFNQVIVKALRKKQIYAELVYFQDISASMIQADPTIKGLILSGGPSSIYEAKAYKIDEAIFELDLPILGICYGMQYLAEYFGGKVGPTPVKEYGLMNIHLQQTSNLMTKTPPKQQV